MKKLRGLNSDIFLIAGYPQIFEKKIFSLPKVMSINLHGGPLPEFRGGSPLNWQIINGRRKIGISLIKINSKIDGGKIIDTKFFNLKLNQDIEIAHKKANKLFYSMVKNFFERFKNQKKISYKKKSDHQNIECQRTDMDGKLDYKNKKSQECLNFIRAISPPYPGAWLEYKTNKGSFLRLFKAKLTKKKFKKKKIYF